MVNNNRVFLTQQFGVPVSQGSEHLNKYPHSFFGIHWQSGSPFHLCSSGGEVVPQTLGEAEVLCSARWPEEYLAYNKILGGMPGP